MSEDTPRDTRPVLDRERVVQVALELLDTVGLDGLTMRRLADQLGVTAAALYWYVRDKDELLGLLSDAISAEILRLTLPELERPWREALTAFADTARRVTLAHRDGARVLVGAIPAGPHRLRGMEALVELLRRAGFDPPDVADAAYLLNSYVAGFVLADALGAQPHAGGTAPQDISHDTPAGLSAARGALASGHLVVEHGASNLTIRADTSLADLYRITFMGRAPEVTAHEGTVRVRQRHGRHTSCEVMLTDAIPWDIEIKGGAWRLTTDLTGLLVTAVRIAGGVSETTLRLTQPTGSVPVRIVGGGYQVRIERPLAAAIRVHLSGGGSRLTLDGLQLRAVGAVTNWESPDYAAAADRYDLELGGGMDQLTVTTTAAAAPEPGAGRSDTSPTVQTPNWLGSLSPQEYPNLVALADQLGSPDLDRRFHDGLQILLDGLERRLARPMDGPPAERPLGPSSADETVVGQG